MKRPLKLFRQFLAGNQSSKASLLITEVQTISQVYQIESAVSGLSTLGKGIYCCLVSVFFPVEALLVRMNFRVSSSVAKGMAIASPFRLQSLRFASNKTMTVREALNSAMAEEMDRDDDVFIIGEEVAQYNGAYKVTKGLLDRFGERRVVDTPITEYGLAGLAVGSALKGLKPIVEFMSFNFSMQAIDHVVNSAAKTHYMSGGTQRCPIVFRGPNGAAVGVGAQHSQDYSAWYGSIPGMKVLVPYSAEDARGLLKAAIRDPNPVVFLENELLYGESFEVSDECLSPDFTLPYTSKIEREGTDISIITYTRNVQFSLQAAEILDKQYGVSAEVLNLRCIRPLDVDAIIKTVKKTNHLITVESTFPQFGVGSEIIAQVMESEAFDYLDAPVQRVTGADVPTPYAKELEDFAFPDPDTIVRAAKENLSIE